MSTMGRLVAVASLILGIAGAVLYLPGAAVAAEDAGAQGAAPQYAPEGAKTCMKCHDQPPVTFILHTPHAQSADSRTPFAHHACETCHGASPQHIATPEKGKKRREPTVVFGLHSPTPPAKQNKVCLSCHQAGLRMNWKGSPHQSSNLPCAACHRIHRLKDPMLVKTEQPQICFTCHKTQQAQVHRFSHHPIPEGKLDCTNCHNPHGGFGPHQLKRDTVNQTCFLCHAEKRGPFLWEHPPVVESCLNCHTPHGSTQPRLLKMRTPFLCQTCHLTAYHPSTVYSGTGVPPMGAASQLLLKGCLNCHSQVHGSNSPSGAFFQR